ncbi:hypothetical protein CMUS01_04932, partial [Colletotrichum musicola]
YPSVAGCVTLASELGGPEYGRVCAAGCGDSGADTSGRPATVLFSVGYIPVFVAYLATGDRHLGTKGWFRLPRHVSLGLADFNVASLILQCVMLCLPPSFPITAENMKWASAVAGSFILFLSFGFRTYGRSHHDAGEDLVIHGERPLEELGESGALDVVDIVVKK